MLSLAKCISAKPLPNLYQSSGYMKSVSHQYKNEGGNEGENEGRNKDGRESRIERKGQAPKSKQSHLYNRIISCSMSIFHIQ